MFKLELLPTASIPSKSHTHYNCYSYNTLKIKPSTTALVNIGFKLQIPFSHFIYVYSTKYKALGGVGDSDYRGVYSVIIFNDTNEDILIEKGEFVGCISFIEIECPKIVVI